MNDDNKQRDVFFCHAYEDKPMIRSIALGLERYGISSWIDEAEMRAGDILVEKIANAIEVSNCFCIFLTANSIKKNWVKFELSQAMEQEIRQGASFIIPVLLHECKIPSFLRPKMYVDLRNWDSYGLALEKLAVAIKHDIKEIPSNFDISVVNNKIINDKTLYSLPIEQSSIEAKLRYDKWSARRIGTLRNYSGLTLMQVINYCELCNHIILSPKFNSIGEIFYGVRWRVMEDQIDENQYKKNVNRFIMMMQSSPIKHKYSIDILKFFLSFYK